MIQIRWHGRGGQGAKTAALLLADVAFSTGMYVQGFPEYGPERMGAPITAYNRLDNSRISIHSNIYDPDIVVVLDETLITAVDVTSGLKPDGAIIINTDKDEARIKAMFPGFTGSIYAIDAREISTQCIGRNLPNTPLLAAAVKVSGIMNKESFLKNMLDSFTHKFSTKPAVITGNMDAVKRSWEEVSKL